MATEIDHTQIKTRIKDILESNVTLYDPSSTDGTKLLSVDLGFPFNNDSIPQVMPSAFVYFENETIRRRGTDQSNAITHVEHDVKYKIAVVIAETTSKQTETQLDSFQKLILESLEENVVLNSGGTDPKADTSLVEKVNSLRKDFNGQVIQGREITFGFTVSSG